MLLEKIQRIGLKLERTTGVISYNKTPWKKYIPDGISTMSTHFKKLGELAANMILHKDQEHIEVPFTLNCRSFL